MILLTSIVYSRGLLVCQGNLKKKWHCTALTVSSSEKWNKSKLKAWVSFNYSANSALKEVEQHL